MKKVVDLIGNDFTTACLQLSNKIEDSSFKPTIIIGILTGGGKVGEIIYERLANQDNKIIYTEIKICRNNTKKKEKGIISKTLKTLPRIVTNNLRILESQYLFYKSKLIEPKRVSQISFTNEIDALLKQGENNILIVDDAIDSGATLKIIKDHIEEKYPNNQTKLAVITVTNKKTMVSVDYCLYNNRTLVRFPWSNDTK